PPTLGGNNTGGLGSLGPAVPPPPPFAPTAPPSLNNLPAPEMMQEPVAEPMVFELSKSQEGIDPSLPTVDAQTKYRKNDSAGMLPAGAFAPVVLLNGLDAGTSAATQSNPMPVLMTVTDQATLPGAARFRLKSCFVLGNGY